MSELQHIHDVIHVFSPALILQLFFQTNSTNKPQKAFRHQPERETQIVHESCRKVCGKLPWQFVWIFIFFSLLGVNFYLCKINFVIIIIYKKELWIKIEVIIIMINNLIINYSLEKFMILKIFFEYII